MKKAKLYLSLLLALVLVAGTFPSGHVFAADNVMSVKVEETASGVALKIVAEKELSFGGIMFTVSFDDTLFTYDGITSPLDVTPPGPNGILLDTSDAVTVNAGDEIAELTFTAGNIVPGDVYTFTVTVTEAYDETFENHVAANTVLTGTYIKAVKYTIKFVNYDGTELQSSDVVAGEMPVYTGDTPTRPETDEYTYTFKGWTPELAAAAADATYTATYTETAKPTEAPAKPTEAPAETSEAPAQTTEAPAQSTEAPTESTKASTAAASTEADATPDTGDDSALTVFIVMGCTAAVLLGVLLVIRRKSNAE